jgi:hypothetical protein
VFLFVVEIPLTCINLVNTTEKSPFIKIDTGQWYFHQMQMIGDKTAANSAIADRARAYLANNSEHPCKGFLTKVSGVAVPVVEGFDPLHRGSKTARHFWVVYERWLIAFTTAKMTTCDDCIEILNDSNQPLFTAEVSSKLSLKMIPTGHDNEENDRR